MKIPTFVICVICVICGNISAQTYLAVPVQWSFTRSNTTMIVTGHFTATNTANYYVERSPNLTSWTTAICWSISNTGPRTFTLQCPLEDPLVKPYAFLRALRGPYDPECICADGGASVPASRISSPGGASVPASRTLNH